MLLEGMGCSCSKGQGKIINGNGVEDKLPHRPSTQVEKILIAYCTACVTEDGSKENAILRLHMSMFNNQILLLNGFLANSGIELHIYVAIRVQIQNICFIQDFEFFLC